MSTVNKQSMTHQHWIGRNEGNGQKVRLAGGREGKGRRRAGRKGREGGREEGINSCLMNK